MILKYLIYCFIESKEQNYKQKKWKDKIKLQHIGLNGNVKISIEKKSNKI